MAKEQATSEMRYRLIKYVLQVLLDTLQLQFTPPLWHTTVNHITVYADEQLMFPFKNGSEVEVRL